MSITGPFVALLGEIGASDCERIADEFLAQPVNAISSFCYVVAAVVIVAISWRRGSLDALQIVFALSLAAVGLGSVAFHGPQPSGSRLMHDLPIVVTLLLMVLHDLGLLRPAFRWPVPFVAGSTAAGLVSWIVPSAASVISGGLVIGLVIVEAIVFRRRQGRRKRRVQIRVYTAIAGVLAAAGTLWFLGRTDGPLCDPDSAVQLHAMWHVTSASVFGLWWWLALAPIHRRTVKVGAEPAVTSG